MPGHCHEPDTRQVQYGRGRRESGPPDAGTGQQESMFSHQTGGLGTLWRYQPLPGERPGDPDQDGPGSKAWGGRSAAWKESLSMGG